MGRFHTTLISSKLIETVNFYEDHFGFVPVVEKEGYYLLQKHDDADLMIAVFDADHPCVNTVSPVQGMILNLTAEDVTTLYDYIYMEGLEIYKALGHDIHGQKHFVVFDPNGVLINVFEPARELVAA